GQKYQSLDNRTYDFRSTNWPGLAADALNPIQSWWQLMVPRQYEQPPLYYYRRPWDRSPDDSILFTNWNLIDSLILVDKIARYIGLSLFVVLSIILWDATRRRFPRYSA